MGSVWTRSPADRVTRDPAALGGKRGESRERRDLDRHVKASVISSHTAESVLKIRWNHRFEPAPIIKGGDIREAQVLRYPQSRQIKPNKLSAS